MNLGGPQCGVLATQGQTFLDAQLLLPGVTIDYEQRIHARDHVDGFAIFWIYFDRVDKLAPGVRPATHVHQFLAADVVVSLIAVGLQNAFPRTQEFARTLSPAAQLKLEHRFAARLAVLP